MFKSFPWGQWKEERQTQTNPTEPPPCGSATRDKMAKPSKPGAMTSYLVLLMLALAILVATLVPTDKDREPRPTDAQLFPASLLDRSPLGDRVFVHEDAGPRYAFGRWKEPVGNLSFHLDEDWKLRLQSIFTTKYWHYSSVNSEQYFIGAAVVKLGYASDAFVYVVDKTTPDYEKFEFTGRLPGDLGLTFASSSIDTKACTSFTSIAGETISFCYDGESSEWRIHANVTMVGANHGEQRSFIADLRLKRDEALTILFPVGNDTLRPAYVHKGAGSPVVGSFQLGEAHVELSGRAALGAIDWTRSQALRCTRWNWASSSFRATVTTSMGDGVSTVEENAAIGINLSKHVYDIDGESQENAIWINGKVHVLRGVEFSVPTSPLKDQWTITTSPTAATEQSIKLSFTPSGGSREDHTHLLIVESDFVQPYGVFYGEIRFIADDGKTKIHVEVAEAFGVVEDHFALW